MELVLRKLHIETPLLASFPLASHTSGQVWLKMDALQPSGSFKLRGLGYACQRYAAAGAAGLVSSSGGNAGLAVAYAGRALGLPVQVFVPHSTPHRAIELIERQGAKVVVYGATWQEAHERAIVFAEETQASYIHPFDDPLIWEGHASLIDEVCQEITPDGVLVAVGGGGLLCGVCEGLHRNGLQDVPVLAVETKGADSLAASLAAGELVSLPDITSLAKTLGAKQVAQSALAWCQRHDIQSAVVSDQQAVEACFFLANEHRVLVEPACGAALAPLLQAHPFVREKQELLVIVCGGAAVTLSQLEQWAQECGLPHSSSLPA